MGRKKLTYCDTAIDENTGYSVVYKADTRKTCFAITVQEGAESFATVRAILQDIDLHKGGNVVFNWAYILHDSDTMNKKSYDKLVATYEQEIKSHKYDDDEEKNQKKIEQLIAEKVNGLTLLGDNTRTVDNWAYKRLHYHILLSFNEAKSWNFIKSKFVGCHIEVCQDLGSAYAYLTHETLDCKKHGKCVYDKEAIQTNNRDYFESIKVKNAVFEPFNVNEISRYIVCDSMYSFLDFGLRFGWGQLERHSNLISKVLKEYELATNSFSERFTKNYVYNLCNGTSVPMTEQQILGQVSSTYSVKLDNFNWCNLQLSKWGFQCLALKYRFGVKFSEFECWFLLHFCENLAKDWQVKPIEWTLGLPKEITKNNVVGCLA